MTNAAASQGLASQDIRGNFGNSVGQPYIHQASNGFLNATVRTISTSLVRRSWWTIRAVRRFSNYELRTRIGASDDDGVGVLLRVQNDNTFYRVNFTSQVTGAGATRAPQGMSVQKVQGGVWTELYRETTPLFVYPFATRWRPSPTRCPTILFGT